MVMRTGLCSNYACTYICSCAVAVYAIMVPILMSLVRLRPFL